MSDQRTHRTVGRIAGGGYAVMRASNEQPGARLLEAAGGVLAGDLGARLPDLLDPPTHPGHRSVAHGVVSAITVARVAHRLLDDGQHWLRAEADRHAALAAQAASPLEQLWHQVLEMLCRIGAGAAAGLIAGYGSHLALDAFTPAGLPIVG